MNRFLINYMWEMLDVARANGVDVGVGRDMFVANLNNFGIEGAEFYPGAENMDYETASEQWKAMPLKEQAEARTAAKKAFQDNYKELTAARGAGDTPPSTASWPPTTCPRWRSPPTSCTRTPGRSGTRPPRTAPTSPPPRTPMWRPWRAGVT